MNPELPRGQLGAARRQVTVLESVEELRAQLRSGGTTQVDTNATQSPGDRQQETAPFRPTVRPPMALLVVLDDGDDNGETIRIRSNSLVIGRVEGDLVIPHDTGMSGQHAEITRRSENGEYSWFLTDLRSTNGTFARASTVVLHEEQELLIGSRRFRFESAAAEAPIEAPANPNVTRKWEVVPKAHAGDPLAPSLVDVTQGRVNQRFPLRGSEVWLGRDPQQCSIVIDDLLLDRRHARIYRDEKINRWSIANNRSKNGVWARIQEVRLGRGSCFQCGEQRFLLKLL
jgi:pSer/pThr/pTyr-binding forkhead associated (FHA) protein